MNKLVGRRRGRPLAPGNCRRIDAPKLGPKLTRKLAWKLAPELAPELAILLPLCSRTLAPRPKKLANMLLILAIGGPDPGAILARFGVVDVRRVAFEAPKRFRSNSSGRMAAKGAACGVAPNQFEYRFLFLESVFGAFAAPGPKPQAPSPGPRPSAPSPRPSAPGPRFPVPGPKPVAPGPQAPCPGPRAPPPFPPAPSSQLPPPVRSLDAGPSRMEDPGAGSW